MKQSNKFRQETRIKFFTSGVKLCKIVTKILISGGSSFPLTAWPILQSLTRTSNLKEIINTFGWTQAWANNLLSKKYSKIIRYSFHYWTDIETKQIQWGSGVRFTNT